MDRMSGQRATRINVNEATREQLMDLLKQQRAQLRQEQLKTKELEQQIQGLHALIEEKNAEITALRHQGTMLTEKAASDEETINALIKQVEESRVSPPLNPSRRFPTGSGGVEAPSTGSSGATANGTIVTGKVASGPSQTVSPTLTASRAPYRVTAPSGVEASNNNSNNATTIANMAAVAAAQEAAFQEKLAATSETIASKNGEIAKLETKVRELMEVNAFYTAIVSQHDEEEKRRHVLATKATNQHSEDEVEDVPTLLQRIATLETHQEKLQRIVKQSERDKNALLSENAQLREEATRLEMEAIASEQWARRNDTTATVLPARGDFATAATLSTLPASHYDLGGSNPRPPQTTPERVPAQVMASPLLLGRSTPSRTAGGIHHHHQASPLAPSPEARDRHQRPRVDIRALPPIHVRNPDPQERELLDRIHVYQDYIAQMENYEADRQASFDEMERSRAELFASMNEQLEKQRKELHRLRRATLGTSNSAASLATVTSLNDDAPVPRTSPDRDAPPPPPVRHPCVTVSVQTEMIPPPQDQEETFSTAHPQDTENDEANRYASLWCDATAALTTACVERDEAEARLRLCIDCADESLRHMRALQASCEQARQEETRRLREESAELVSQLAQIAHDNENSVTSMHGAREGCARGVDCEITSHRAIGETAPPAQWAAFLDECDAVLHREDVGLCLDMYGDALIAYAALLSASAYGDTRPAANHLDDDEEARINAQVLEGIRHIATWTVSTAAAASAPLPEVQLNEAATAVETGVDGRRGEQEEAPLTYLAEESPNGADTDGIRTREEPERIGVSDWEADERGDSTVRDNDDSSSAPNSHGSHSTISSPPSPRDQGAAKAEAMSKDGANVVLQAITPEEEEELLRQLAAEAEIPMGEGHHHNDGDNNPTSERAVGSDLLISRSAPLASEDDQIAHERPDMLGNKAQYEAHHDLLDEASGVDHSDAAVSVPSSLPNSQRDQAVSPSDSYDEDLHIMVSHTETSTPPDAAADAETDEVFSTEIREEAVEDERGEEQKTTQERQENGRNEVRLFAEAESSLCDSEMRPSEGRPRLPPLPEGCTSEKVAAAIDACHQYAISRHASQPATPRRGYRSVMSSNRTSTSVLDSWPKHMPGAPDTPSAAFSSLPPADSSPATSQDAAPAFPLAMPWNAVPPVNFGQSNPAPSPPPRVPQNNTLAPPFSVGASTSDDDFEADFDPFA